MLRFARRSDALGTESAYVVLAAARRLEAQGRDVVHLEIGEPSADTPPHVVEAGIRALRAGLTHYAVPAGIPELRAAVADHVRLRGVRASAEHVVVTAGAKPMLFYALLSLVEPGDEVLCPDPGFPIYESVVRLAGGRPVPYPMDAERGFRASVDALAELVSPRTRALVLNSPHNPTGLVATGATLAALADLAQRHDLWVISDEVYSRLLYEGETASIAAVPGMSERTVLVDGFSKSYAMTGWRLGYGVMPQALQQRVTKLLINNASCTATFVQHAGIAALTGPQDFVTRMGAELRARRDLMVSGLASIDGVTCPSPAGAFYAFPDLSSLLEQRGLTADAFADRLLAEHGVAVLAGTAFGPGGAGHLRLSFAAPRAEIERGVERVACAVEVLAPV